MKRKHKGLLEPLPAGPRPAERLPGPSDWTFELIEVKAASRVREHHDAGADHVCIQVLTDSPTDLPIDAWRDLAEAFAL